MKDLLNCPNCAAPIQSDVCPYCGSVFLDWACFDVNKPTFVKIRNHFGHIVLMKLSPVSISERMDTEPTSLYADNRIYQKVFAQPTITIEAEFEAVPFRHALTDKTVLNIDIDPEKADEDVKRAALLGLKE